MHSILVFVPKEFPEAIFVKLMGILNPINVLPVTQELPLGQDQGVLLQVANQDVPYSLFPAPLHG